MEQDNFETLLKIGEDGEHEVAKYLIKKDLSILPLYQFNNNKTPLLFCKNANLILPDLTCFNKKDDKKCFFVEVKTKKQWVKFKNRIETGIDYRLYLAYKKVIKQTQMDVYLIFNHKVEKPTGLFLCKLQDYTRIWDGKVNNENKYNKMVFYNIEILKNLTK